MRTPTITSLLVMTLALPFSLFGQYRAQSEKAATDANTPLTDFHPERSTLWNSGWEFSDGNGKEQWRSVTLPHDFQIELPWTNRNNTQGFKPVAEGWYRKSFKAMPEWKGKRVSLDVDGLLYYGDVYLNGHRIGSTDYGYSGFEAEMTPYLDFEGENVI